MRVRLESQEERMRRVSQVVFFNTKVKAGCPFVYIFRLNRELTDHSSYALLACSAVNDEVCEPSEPVVRVISICFERANPSGKFGQLGKCPTGRLFPTCMSR
jgi:hypothetical protein